MMLGLAAQVGLVKARSYNRDKARRPRANREGQTPHQAWARARVPAQGVSRVWKQAPADRVERARRPERGSVQRGIAPPTAVGVASPECASRATTAVWLSVGSCAR